MVYKCAVHACDDPAEHYSEMEDEAYIKFRARHCTRHWRELWKAMLFYGFVSDTNQRPTDHMGSKV